MGSCPGQNTNAAFDVAANRNVYFANTQIITTPKSYGALSIMAEISQTTAETGYGIFGEVDIDSSYHWMSNESFLTIFRSDCNILKLRCALTAGDTETFSGLIHFYRTPIKLYTTYTTPSIQNLIINTYDSSGEDVYLSWSFNHNPPFPQFGYLDIYITWDVDNSSSSSISSSSKTSSSFSSATSFSISSLSSISSSSLSSISSSSVSSISSSSPSSISSSSLSSISSSSVEKHIYNLGRKTTYLSICKDEQSIINPETGWDANMSFVGFFDKDQYTNDSKEHIEKNGLVKNLMNQGTIFCPDASKLFYSKIGGVSISLSLPYKIENGIYEPLKNNTNSVIQDYLIWAVNIGKYYITQPGFYAAFTPLGIELTVWTSAGKFTALDTISNIDANTDFTLDFAWNKNGVLKSFDANMVIFCNNSLTAWNVCPIVNDSLHNIYYVNKLGYKHANFCALNNISNSFTFDAIVRRLETFTALGNEEADILSDGLSTQSYNLISSNISMPLSFYGVPNNLVNVHDVEFNTTIQKILNIGEIKEMSSNLNQYGEDSGKQKSSQLPYVPEGLPLGISIVKK